MMKMLLSYSLSKLLVLISLASVSAMLDHIPEYEGTGKQGIQHLKVSNDADQHIILINPEPVFEPEQNNELILEEDFWNTEEFWDAAGVDLIHPSISPTESPTKSPTVRHSATPTIPHSNQPSSSPTESSTTSPIIYHSGTPTIPHSNQPSSSPTKSPSKSPTIYHSTFPTISHFNRPSSLPVITFKNNSGSPSLEPTKFPSEITDECNFENGETFGEITTNRKTLSYYYEVETKGTPNLNEVLQSLEKSIGNSILKELYIECDNQRHLTITGLRRQLKMTGLTSSPSDKVTNGSCSNSPSNGNTCALVEGVMWIYFDSSEDDANEEAQIHNIIKQGMYSGKFNEADPSIVRVTYVNAPTILENELSTPGSRTSAQPAKGTLESRYIILMSFSVVAVAVGVVATRKYFNKNKNLDDSDFSDPDNSNMMNPLSPSNECSQEYSDGSSELCSTSMIMSESSESSEFNDTSIIYDHRRKKTFDFGDVTIEEVDLDDTSVEDIPIV